MRMLSEGEYARRIEHHHARGHRRGVVRTTGVALIAILVAFGLTRVAHASSPRHATPAVQKAVDKVVGHHVPKLWQECRGRKCAAFTMDMRTAFVLFETATGYRVTSGVR